ncbi:MAG: DUF4105 domain-containing protein [Bacteroidetes bacterium]|nr:DUF4105 domain-containing protein [Fibrella sp.]
MKTMTKYSGLLAGWLLLATCGANAQYRLSPSAQVSLITVAPGEEIYSSFGHTGLRVYDPAQGLDRHYSYGTFDFRTDNFYLKFIRGTLPYQLSVNALYDELYGWQMENRTVREQILNLSPAQKQRLLDGLEENYKPENRTYAYKFYYDNCATRPPNRVIEACGDSLRFNPARDAELSKKSYREWMNDYLGQKPWARFGMNLAVGQPADHVTTATESMYLPDNVHDRLAAATLRQPNGQTVPLVTREQVLFQARGIARQTPPLWAIPEFFFLVVLIAVGYFTYRHYQTNVRGLGLDRFLFGISGLAGWILFLLWVATDHGVTGWNPGLLWLFPLHLPLIYWVTRPQNQRHLGVYFRVVGVLLALGFLFSKVPGPADGMFIITLYIRAFYQGRFKPKTEIVPIETA